MLSIVIPTLDSAATLESALDALAEGGDRVAEIVVADGGSRDGTRDIAARRGARVVSVTTGEVYRNGTIVTFANLLVYGVVGTVWILFVF